MNGMNVAVLVRSGLELRQLETDTGSDNMVVAVDAKGAGNANHRYLVVDGHRYQGYIQFVRGGANGGIVPGMTNEDLLAIVADRLKGFQSGDFPCQENDRALRATEEAMACLKYRTKRIG